MDCLSCRWIRYRLDHGKMVHYCRLGKVLVWCSQYEREPGSDDENNLPEGVDTSCTGQ